VTTATDYYERQFPKDMGSFRGFYARKPEPHHGVVVSVVDLIPFLPGGMNSESVQRRPVPHRQCFCIFFVTLLDQTLHSTIGESHDSFFERVRHPKLHGFLGSAESIVHPVFALLAATLHIQAKNVADSAATDFQELTGVLMNEYQRVVATQISQQAYARTLNDIQYAQTLVYEELAKALTRGAYPTDLKPFLPAGSKARPDASMVDGWVDQVRHVLVG
jgi:hypothetical protein